MPGCAAPASCAAVAMNMKPPPPTCLWPRPCAIGCLPRSGVRLFVDDLHWSDNGTISFLQYLLRRLRGERLLVLGAYREIELDRAHPLSAAPVEWKRARLVTP